MSELYTAQEALEFFDAINDVINFDDYHYDEIVAATEAQTVLNEAAAIESMFSDVVDDDVMEGIADKISDAKDTVVNVAKNLYEKFHAMFVKFVNFVKSKARAIQKAIAEAKINSFDKKSKTGVVRVTPKEMELLQGKIKTAKQLTEFDASAEKATVNVPVAELKKYMNDCYADCRKVDADLSKFKSLKADQSNTIDSLRDRSKVAATRMKLVIRVVNRAVGAAKDDEKAEAENKKTQEKLRKQRSDAVKNKQDTTSIDRRMRESRENRASRSDANRWGV